MQARSDHPIPWNRSVKTGSVRLPVQWLRTGLPAHMTDEAKPVPQQSPVFCRPRKRPAFHQKTTHSTYFCGRSLRAYSRFSRSDMTRQKLGVAIRGCVDHSPGQDEEGSPRALQEQVGNTAEGDWHVELRARSQWPRRVSRARIVLGIAEVHGERWA